MSLFSDLLQDRLEFFEFSFYLVMELAVSLSPPPPNPWQYKCPACRDHASYVQVTIIVSREHGDDQQIPIASNEDMTI